MPDELEHWIPTLIAQNNIHAFYISKAWLRLRSEVLKDQHNECQLCRAEGRYQMATTVHHKKTVRKYPRLALEKGNLIAVCDSCHYKIHHGNSAKWNDERW